MKTKPSRVRAKGRDGGVPGVIPLFPLSPMSFAAGSPMERIREEPGSCAIAAILPVVRRTWRNVTIQEAREEGAGKPGERSRVS
jgi:hypothetical protein